MAATLLGDDNGFESLSDAGMRQLLALLQGLPVGDNAQPAVRDPVQAWQRVWKQRPRGLVARGVAGEDLVGCIVRQ